MTNMFNQAIRYADYISIYILHIDLDISTQYLLSVRQYRLLYISEVSANIPIISYISNVANKSIYL
jgi:hypothetical protein